jgi:hypothetical protein
MAELRNCRICGATSFLEIINLGSQPLSGVFPAPGDPVSTSGPLRLLRCSSCNLVQLGDTYAQSEMYGDTYGYRSGLNKTMTDHLRRVAEGLIKFIDLSPSDLVIDIGANDGTFLNYFAGHGISAVGIDPTSLKYEEFFDPKIRVIGEFFSSEIVIENKIPKAKLVTSIAMFYDLESPLDFARDVSETLEDGGFWFLEQSYAPWMRQSGAYDTICHEHLEYYSLLDLEYILNETGFEIVKATTNAINGGSFGILAQKRKPSGTFIVDPYVEWLKVEERKSNTEDNWMEFAEVVEERRLSLHTLIANLKDKGNKISGLGASTKGNVLLNFTGLNSNLVDKIGEVNPYKFGRFTPGSNIPIAPDDEVFSENPDYLIFLPWHFRENALNKYEEFLTRGGRIIFPLPNVEIIGY